MSRSRSIAIMTLLWTAIATILGACYGVGIWLFKDPSLPLIAWVGVYAMVGAMIGVVGGGIFSLALTRQNGRGSIDELRLGRFALLGTLAGALAGIGGFILVSLMVDGRVRLEQAALYCTIIGAVAGGPAAAAMLAIARRAPAITAGERRDLIES